MKHALIIVLIIVLRWIIVTMLILGYPELKWHNRWVFHQGGDHIIYFEGAKNFAEFKISKCKYPYGYPVFLAIFIKIANAKEWKDIIANVVIFQGYILSALAILSLVFIGKKLKNLYCGYICAFMWAISPYILYFLLGFHRHAHILRGSALPNYTWLQIAPDGLCIVLSLYLAWAYLQYIEKPYKSLAVIIGILTGLLVVNKYSNVALLSLLSLFIYLRQPKALLICISTFVVILLPQLIHNTYFFHSPFHTGYELDKWVVDERSYFAWHNPIKFFLLLGKYPLLMVVISGISLILIGELIYLCRERKFLHALVLALPPLSIFILHLFCYVLRYDPLRYLAPITPFILILLSSTITRVIR